MSLFWLQMEHVEILNDAVKALDALRLGRGPRGRSPTLGAPGGALSAPLAASPTSPTLAQQQVQSWKVTGTLVSAAIPVCRRLPPQPRGPLVQRSSRCCARLLLHELQLTADVPRSVSCCPAAAQEGGLLPESGDFCRCHGGVSWRQNFGAWHRSTQLSMRTMCELVACDHSAVTTLRRGFPQADA